MSRDSSGNYTLPSGNPVVTGTTIESTWANTTLSDVSTALTNSLDRTGKGGMTAELKLDDGTLGSPGLQFNDETNTGLYRVSSGVVVMSVLGTELLRYSADEVNLTSADAAATAGPTLRLSRDSASPADDDLIGTMIFEGQNDAAEDVIYGQIGTTINAVADGFEGGKFVFETMQLGTLTTAMEINELGGATLFGTSTVTTGASAAGLELFRNDGTPQDDDEVGVIKYQGQDDGGNTTDYATIKGISSDVTDATEDGQIVFQTMQAGTLTDIVTMSTILTVDASTTLNGEVTINDDLLNIVSSSSPEIRLDDTDVTAISRVQNSNGNLVVEADYQGGGGHSAMLGTNAQYTNVKVADTTITFDVDQDTVFTFNSDSEAYFGNATPSHTPAAQSQMLAVGNLDGTNSEGVVRLGENASGDGVVSIFGTRVGATQIGSITSKGSMAVAGNGGGDNYTIDLSSNHVWDVSSSEVMRINSDGDLLIGGTVDAGTLLTRATALDEIGFDGPGGFQVVCRDSTAHGIYVNKTAEDSSTSTNYIQFRNQGTITGDISYDGADVAIVQASDVRLKENIQPAQDAGSIIDGLEVVSFDWKTGGHSNYGFIAQDAHKVFPDMVREGGEDVTEEPWMVADGKLVPLLLKEIQSLRQRVAQLENE